MTHLSKTLMTEQILYTENVLALRNGIALKYPHASSKERADLLAKAIKRILHKHLASLEENTQNALVHELLKTAIQKQDFSINAHDIVASYAALDTVKAEGLAPLAAWLSETTGQKISPKEMVTVFSFLEPLHENPPIPSNNSISLDNQLLSPDDALFTDSISFADEDLAAAIVQPALESAANALISTDFPYKKVIGLAGSFCLAASMLLLITSLQTPSTKASPQQPIAPAPSAHIAAERPADFLIPEESYLMAPLQYKPINEAALRQWLIGRNALLAEDPYFSTIIKAAASYNINPLLMFAITGQEQGFVPKTHERAFEIANNPFNVYGSWQDFNTDIEDTAFIAARTIINLSKGCPEDADPIKWLNQKYAEDPNWHKGVTSIFNQLEKTAGQ